MQASKNRYLIILRGVPGAGKSQVGKVVVERLGAEAQRFDLDRYAPDNEQAQFEAMIVDAMNYRYVIGELYSGRRRSSEPASWIGRFRGQYNVQSFVLRVSEEKGWKNCSDPRHDTWQPRSREEYGVAYEKFEARQLLNEFASKAGIKETVLNAEDGDFSRIASEAMHLAGLAQTG